MEIYCRACSGVLVKDADIMGPSDFKKRYGTHCPHCGVRLSDEFNVVPSTRVNQRKR